MKKLILAMVFVFATGTMMNANTTSTINLGPGFDDCDTYATIVGKLYNLSYEEEHNEFVACMEME